MRLYIRSHMVSHGLVRSRTVLYDRLYDYTRTWHPCQFFKVLKTIHGFHGYTRIARV